MMPKPICVKCQRFYRPHKNGTYWCEMMPIGGVRALPGTAAPHLWEPYKVWQGDLWRCEGCGSEIIVGNGQIPVSEHFKPDFIRTIIDTNADRIQINDC